MTTQSTDEALIEQLEVEGLTKDQIIDIYAEYAEKNWQECMWLADRIESLEYELAALIETMEDTANGWKADILEASKVLDGEKPKT